MQQTVRDGPDGAMSLWSPGPGARPARPAEQQKQGDEATLLHTAASIHTARGEINTWGVALDLPALLRARGAPFCRGNEQHDPHRPPCRITRRVAVGRRRACPSRAPVYR